MRVWHFIAYAYIFSLNMYGHEASMTRCLFSPAPLSTPILFVWGAVKALMRLSACVAMPSCWRLIGCIIYTQHLMIWLIFLQSRQC